MFIRILIPTRVPKIIGIHPLDDPNNRFLVSDFLTCTAPRTVAFAPEQLRFLLEPIILALTPIAYDTAIPNIPTYIISLDLNAVPVPVVHIRVDASALALTAVNGFETMTYQPHSDVTHATIENLNYHCTSYYTIFIIPKRFFHSRTGIPVIPFNLIMICTNRDFIRVLECTYHPRTGPNIIPIPPSEKVVAFAIPGSESPLN